VTYAALGAVAGALGGGIASVGRLAGIEKTGSILAGACMIIAALALSGWMARPATVQIGASPSLVSRAAGRLLRVGSGSNKLLLGLVMGLLPCGMVYAALLKAVEAGAPLDGALSMLAFGAGTSGALLAIGFFSSAITARFGRHATALACASMLLLGGFLLYRGFRASAPAGQTCSYHANPS
jgi:sulfite exporter TauE/SafE